MGNVCALPRVLAQGVPSGVSISLDVTPTCSPFRSHTTLKLTKVNTYGLVYVWEGSDESLKPLLLAAHQGWTVRLS